ncbi:MAG: aldolase/citrate lyase family protein [Pseudonocardia sp.]
MSPTPVNPFKQALRRGRPQIGFWLGLASAYSAEICAGAGFDWLLIDCEHGPQSLPLVLAQLQAIDAAGGAHAVVRVPSDDPVALKQYLDLGARSVLVPMVDTAAQAEAVVRACRYPPLGVRGIGGARASRWGRHPNYPHEAAEQTCVLVQAETRLALRNLAEISAVDGVDGVFIGPADLAASMGHLGDAGHPEVRAAVSEAFQVIMAAGKPPGVLATAESLAHEYRRAGAVFVAVGVDTHLLARQTEALAARFALADGTPEVLPRPTADGSLESPQDSADRPGLGGVVAR